MFVTSENRQNGKRSEELHSETGLTPRSKKIKIADNRIVGSPSVVSALSQDDSFFESVIEELPCTANSEKDLFADSDEEVENTKNIEEVESQVMSPGNNLSLNVSAVDTQTSSLPSTNLSILDVRAKALEEIQNKPNSIRIRSQKQSQASKLVEDKLDLGPFFGLPSKVKELYIEHKGVTELFLWQEKCLKSSAVKSKSNFLYSLPTSGGKTLVAEIIMLQELLCYKKNTIFILPYVSIVQEKIKTLTPFALELGFYLEEYAGPKGKFPPTKRLHKQSLFVCTIEKAHALFNSLVSEGRETELGLVVVDEVHMLAEGERGANLESLLVKLQYLTWTRQLHIQIVAMSATVGNLQQLAKFLQAELFTDKFRPVDLEENIKVGRDILSVQKNCAVNDQFKFKRKVDKEAISSIEKIDEDGVTELVLEVFPEHSVLLFCDSKKRCENVSDMLAKVIFMKEDKCSNILAHKSNEKIALLSALKADGSGFVCPILQKTIPFGLAYHHSGLTMDERKVLEDAFLSGTLGVLCCTSTLAAGVNLPARRVIIRSPYMGRNQLTNAQYKQMVGRAGRAGLDTHGESFMLVKTNLTNIVPDIVTAPVEKCSSCLESASQGKLLSSLLLNCIHLNLISTPAQAAQLLSMSLLSLQSTSVASLLSKSLQFLLDQGLIRSDDETDKTQQTVNVETPLVTTKLGRACVSGNIDLAWAATLYSDLELARPSLAVDTSLHLLYLVTPYDLVSTDRQVYSASNYHGIYERLSESERAVARNIGVTDGIMVGLIMGRKNKKHDKILNRLYYALMLLDLWQAMPIHQVAEKFQVSRGEVQSLMSSAASFSNSVFHFCQEIEEFWAYQELLEPFSRRLAHCCLPELLPLLDLPGVKIGRAKQLYSAGFITVADVARSQGKDLVKSIEHLSYKAAHALIEAAKLIVIERIEALKDEAEIAMLDIG